MGADGAWCIGCQQIMCLAGLAYSWHLNSQNSHIWSLAAQLYVGSSGTGIGTWEAMGGTSGEADGSEEVDILAVCLNSYRGWGTKMAVSWELWV